MKKVKKQILKKVITNIDMLLLISILIATIISVRNIEIYRMLQISINCVMTIYVIIRIIKKNPIKIIQSKMDILVIIFVISTTIPLITNKYISLHATVIMILNYLTLFWVYILTREIVKKKGIQIFLNIIIFLTIVLILVGIENLATNKIFEIFKIDYIINGESRLVSIFGNPNAFAGLIVFSYFLSLNQIIDEKKEIKRTIYNVINTVLIIGLILTYSKLMFIIFPLMLTIYMITLRDKKKNIYIIQNIIISLIISVIYSYEFTKMAEQESYFAILILSIFLLILAIVSNILSDKVVKYTEKIKIRTIVFVGTIIVILSSIWISIELKKTKEFTVFSKNSTTNYNAKIIKEIEPSKKYTISLDMTASMELARDEEAQDIFSINIIQRDEKNIEIKNQEEEFGQFSGIKDIEIETTENTKEIKIEFKSKYKYTTKQWIINSLKLNGKEITLEYKHLPTKLVEKINDININYKTAKERFEFIKDGLKIISENPITGIGGEGWQYKYEEVQEYAYITKDTHSYITQVWIEFGILGIISLIGIIYCIIIKKDKRFKGIKFAILSLLLHSTFDSDMYFQSMILLLFFSLGVLAIVEEEKTAKSNQKKEYIINIGLLIIPIVTIILYLNPKMYNKKIRINEIKKAKIGLYVNSEEYKNLNKQMVQAYEEVIKYERGISERRGYELEKINSYIISGQKDIEALIKKYYEEMVNYKNRCNYSLEKIVEKSMNINKVITMLEKQEQPQLYPWIVKLAQINIDEFEETKQKMEKAIEQKYGDLEKEEEYQLLLEAYHSALISRQNYLFGISIKSKTQKDITEIYKQEEFKIDNKEDIIIYHTHTTEGYESNNEDYEPIELGKTLNKKYNILSVGEELKSNLQNKNFKVEHIEEYHDIEGINGAYDRSENTLINRLKEHEKQVDIVFDVHRDAYESYGMESNAIKINGESVANLRFVIAVGHEGWQNNLKWAIALQKQADKMYPGLFKPLFVYDNTYNQSITKCATLIEVGNNANTVEEAKRSMKYFSEVIEKVVK